MRGDCTVFDQATAAAPSCGYEGVEHSKVGDGDLSDIDQLGTGAMALPAFVGAVCGACLATAVGIGWARYRQSKDTDVARRYSSVGVRGSLSLDTLSTPPVGPAADRNPDDVPGLALPSWRPT